MASFTKSYRLIWELTVHKELEFFFFPLPIRVDIQSLFVNTMPVHVGPCTGIPVRLYTIERLSGQDWLWS